MKYTSPEFKLKAFNCPLCGAFAHMEWNLLGFNYTHSMYHEASCMSCKEPSLWRVTKLKNHPRGGREDLEAHLIYPDSGIAPLPVEDMPDDVRLDYNEAASIFTKSPRGAAALLRLGLQKLCVHLGEGGGNIDQDIRSLAKKQTLPAAIIQVADTVRITGNNAVHPGTMSDKDFDQVASKMFALLNFIVTKGISEPKELDALYNQVPEAPRKAAEDKDQKAIAKKSEL
jgi:hypothetical protein